MLSFVLHAEIIIIITHIYTFTHINTLTRVFGDPEPRTTMRIKGFGGNRNVRENG